MDPATVTLIMGSVPLVVLLMLALWVALMYNSLVRITNHMKESWSDIDTELKRRHDLIPNLVETVRGYAKHEREVLESVIRARQVAMAPHATPALLATDENMLVGALRGLFAISEAYPELKANTNFLRLQQELINTEDRVQAARRFYNGNVRDLNNLVETFPTMLIAMVFGFKKGDFFEVEDLKIRQPVSVQF